MLVLDAPDVSLGSSELVELWYDFVPQWSKWSFQIPFTTKTNAVHCIQSVKRSTA